MKCFVAPSEPTDKRNHLDNLDKATTQAEAKRAWADENREAVAVALGVDLAKAEELRMVEGRLRDPPSLKRFNDRLTWRRIPFRTSNDSRS